MSTYRLPRYLTPEQIPTLRHVDRAERIEALINNLANEFGSLTPAKRDELKADLFDTCWRAAADIDERDRRLDTITLEPVTLAWCEAHRVRYSCHCPRCRLWCRQCDPAGLMS